MRKLLAVLFLASLFIAVPRAEDPKILTTGIQTFVLGGAGTVLADSGPYPGDVCRSIQWALISASVSANIVVQTRDAANTATTFSHVFPVSALTVQFLNRDMVFCLLDQERVRFVLQNNITGSVQVSMRVD